MIVDIFFTFGLLYILIYISKEDINTMLISENKLVLFFILGFSYLFYSGYSDEKTNSINLILNNIFSMFIVFLIMSSISCIGYKLFRTNSLGLGDIKLSSISSIWLGMEMSFISLLISFLLSAIYSFYGKIFRQFKTFHQYPFAPFLSIGIFCSWILDKI